MIRGIFLTATGTEVGKTIVTAGILRYLREHALDAVSMKPIQTGAHIVDGALAAPDLLFHHAAANYTPHEDETHLLSPYLYEPACSPHLAGRLADDYPEIPIITQAAAVLAERHRAILVEGAGGVMAPVNESQTMLDLMRALKLPVILVAPLGLGVINHALLSIHAIRRAKLELLGVVFNETEDVAPDYIRQDNPDAVAHFGDVDILANIPYLGKVDPNDATIWSRFEQNFPALPDLLEFLE